MSARAPRTMKLPQQVEDSGVPNLFGLFSRWRPAPWETRNDGSGILVGLPLPRFSGIMMRRIT